MSRRWATAGFVAVLTAVFSLQGMAQDQPAQKKETQADKKDASADTKDAAADKQEAPEDDRPVMKSQAEWAKVLTRAQFMVCRMKETEPAFSGKYVHTKVRGTFVCVACGHKLFATKQKFESGTGWPSFWRPLGPKSVAFSPDMSAGTPRVEVTCRRCGSHLGHVFNDGPPPTGLRYCINSISLKLVPDSAAAKSSAPAKKTRSKTAAKTKKNATKAGTQDQPSEEPARKAAEPGEK